MPNTCTGCTPFAWKMHSGSRAPSLVRRSKSAASIRGTSSSHPRISRSSASSSRLPSASPSPKISRDADSTFRPVSRSPRSNFSMSAIPFTLLPMPPVEFVSVILPTYNEVENIVPLLRAIDAAVSQPHELIVVDDNSPDGTARKVREVMVPGDLPCVRLEVRTHDRGLTKSLQRGIELAKGDTVVWMDCDFSMPPEKIPELLSQVERGCDIAVGSRFVSGGAQKGYDPGESPLAIFLSSMLNLTLRWSLSPRFHD